MPTIETGSAGADLKSCPLVPQSATEV